MSALTPTRIPNAIEVSSTPQFTNDNYGTNGHRKMLESPNSQKSQKKSPSRQWKCPEAGCKFAIVGWPTQGDLKRHLIDKHDPNPQRIECLYPPCTHTSKRWSNLQQHMEKMHGYVYNRTKHNSRKRPTNTHSRTTSLSMSPMPMVEPASPTSSSSVAGSSPELDLYAGCTMLKHQPTFSPGTNTQVSPHMFLQQPRQLKSELMQMNICVNPALLIRSPINVAPLSDLQPYETSPMLGSSGFDDVPSIYSPPALGFEVSPSEVSSELFTPEQYAISSISHLPNSASLMHPDPVLAPWMDSPAISGQALFSLEDEKSPNTVDWLQDNNIAFNGYYS